MPIVIVLFVCPRMLQVCHKKLPGNHRCNQMAREFFELRIAKVQEKECLRLCCGINFSIRRITKIRQNYKS